MNLGVGISIAALLATGCAVDPSESTKALGQFTPPPYQDFCWDAQNISWFAWQQCSDQIVLPDLPSDEIPDELQSYLLVTYDSPDIVDFDTEPVTLARVACLPARPAYPDPSLDCATGLACLSDHGISFPDSWPDALYADQATRCGGPRSQGWSTDTQ